MVKVGDTVELVKMGDDPNPVKEGTKGVVTSIHELHYWKQTQVWVDWEDGRNLAVILPEDQIKVVS